MNTLSQKRRNFNLAKLPSLGEPLTFEEGSWLDQGAIDDFCKTRALGLYLPIDPEFLRLLLKNDVRQLWIYE